MRYIDPQAALGGTIDVLTLDGMVEMKVKAGTQSGTKMSLTGKGVKYLNSSMSVSNRR
jgi:molecular chaperone DnaJ